jgi:hypothetical protein
MGNGPSKHQWRVQKLFWPMMRRAYWRFRFPLRFASKKKQSLRSDNPDFIKTVSPKSQIQFLDFGPFESSTTLLLFLFHMSSKRLTTIINANTKFWYIGEELVKAAGEGNLKEVQRILNPSRKVPLDVDYKNVTNFLFIFDLLRSDHLAIIYIEWWVYCFTLGLF